MQQQFFYARGESKKGNARKNKMNFLGHKTHRAKFNCAKYRKGNIHKHYYYQNIWP